MIKYIDFERTLINLSKKHDLVAAFIDRELYLSFETDKISKLRNKLNINISFWNGFSNKIEFGYVDKTGKSVWTRKNDIKVYVTFMVTTILTENEEMIRNILE